MKKQIVNIPLGELRINPFTLWEKDWLLLTSGDFAKASYNSMTVGWGSFGYLWKKPIVMVVVRPTRFTYKFIEDYSTFTLCGFPEEYRKALTFLGTKSGRDSDKMDACGLTPIFADTVESPTFKEADLSIEVKKIYLHDFNPGKFLDPQIEKQYPSKNYHRMYFGEIKKINGDLKKYSV
ncbi:MAG: flavin reductase [Anaerolineaceae bacterium]|nr:flavin reductase [Anaerolineaceae bacterium]